MQTKTKDLTGTVQARVPMKLKTDSERIFSALGMTTSSAINIFLQSVVNYRRIPFEIALPDDVPNAATREAIAEGRAGKGTRYGSKEELYGDLSI